MQSERRPKSGVHTPRMSMSRKAPRQMKTSTNSTHTRSRDFNWTPPNLSNCYLTTSTLPLLLLPTASITWGVAGCPLEEGGLGGRTDDAVPASPPGVWPEGTRNEFERGEDTTDCGVPPDDDDAVSAEASAPPLRCRSALPPLADPLDGVPFERNAAASAAAATSSSSAPSSVSAATADRRRPPGDGVAPRCCANGVKMSVSKHAEDAAAWSSMWPPLRDEYSESDSAADSTAERGRIEGE